MNEDAYGSTMWRCHDFRLRENTLEWGMCDVVVLVMFLRVCVRGETFCYSRRTARWEKCAPFRFARSSRPPLGVVQRLWKWAKMHLIILILGQNFTHSSMRWTFAKFPMRFWLKERTTFENGHKVYEPKTDGASYTDHLNILRLRQNILGFVTHWYCLLITKREKKVPGSTDISVTWRWRF